MHLFDKGWNAVREQISANQKKLGVIPQDAKLTPWPDDILKSWDKLTDVSRKSSSSVKPTCMART